MYYRRAGSGPPLLCLHGLGGGSGYWEGVVRDLAGTRTTLTPDLLGFGRSAWPDTDYSPATHVAALKAVLEDAEVEPPYDLAGHSAGGVLAMDLARALPGQVRSLTIVCTPYPRREPTTPERLWPRRAVRPSSPRFRTQQRRQAAIAWLWRRIVSVYKPRGYPRAALWDYWTYSMWAYLDTVARVLNGRDFAVEAEPIAALPILQCYGQADRLAPRADAESYRSRFERSTLRFFPAGHQILVDRHTGPNARRTILTWLDRLKA